MSAPIYVVDCSTAPFTSLTTLQTLIGVKGASDFGLMLKKFRVGFTGVAANASGILRIFSCTFATNAPGTASTTMTPVQVSGRTLASGCTGAFQWTTEPTVKTYVDAVPLTPNGGTIMYDWPLGDEPDTPALSSGFGLELTITPAVGVYATLWFSRI